MEKFEKTPRPTDLEEKLEKFREEFRALKNENPEKLDNVNPDKLGEKEMDWWNQLKKADTWEKLLELEKNWHVYSEELGKEVEKELTQKLAQKGLEGDALKDVFSEEFYKDSRIGFIGFLGNKILEKQAPYILKEKKD